MLNKVPISLFSLILCAFTVFCVSIHPALAQRSRSKTIEELKLEIENILSQNNVPGATIALVTRDERIWINGIGYANVETGARADTNTIFRWGSVSKSFVAASIQILAERGLVRLEDRIGDIIPEIEVHNRWEATHPIRVVHCLEHTAGFDDLHFNDCAVDDPDISLSDALAINPNSRRSRWKPGTYRSYSNVGPVVAAYVVEAVSGHKFEDFVKRQIFDPLGMKTACFYHPTETDLMSEGYGDDGVSPIAYDHIAYRPAGSLNASAKEMASFVQMLLNRGAVGEKRILTPQSVIRMETPTTTLAAQAGFPQGYGMGIYTTPRGQYLFRGHGGMIAGFTASYGYNAKLNRGYAVSINKVSDAALQGIIEAVITYLAVEIEGPEPQPAIQPDENVMVLTGYYQSMTPMTQLLHTLVFRFLNVRKVTMKDGVLYSGNFLFGKQRELIARSDNGYHRKDSDESLTFIEDGHDKVMCYSSLRGNFKKAAPAWIFFQFGAFILALVLMASSVLFAVIWVPRKLMGRCKGVRYLNARLVPLLAVLFFFATYIPLLVGLMLIEVDKAMMARLGFLTICSFAIFVSSICFAIFSFLGLFFSLRALFAEMGKVSHVHSVLVSIVNVVVVVYLWYGNVVGIMTWSY